MKHLLSFLAFPERRN